MLFPAMSATNATNARHQAASTTAPARPSSPAATTVDQVPPDRAGSGTGTPPESSAVFIASSAVWVRMEQERPRQRPATVDLLGSPVSKVPKRSQVLLDQLERALCIGA